MSTSQNNTLKGSWKDTFDLLALCRDGRNNDQHIFISLDNSHYYNCASFFNVPDNNRSFYPVLDPVLVDDLSFGFDSTL